MEPATPARHLAFAALLPHPPIVVPEVGRSRGEDCRATLAACRLLAERLVTSRPDRLILISPHSPRAQAAYGLFAGARLEGDLSRFGAPDSRVSLPNDALLAAAIDEAVHRHHLRTWWIPAEPLDHGATVPLYFLEKAGWTGPTVVMSLPWHATPGDHAALGAAIAEAIAEVPGKTAFVASGDMSHRVTRGAPAGYHPRAIEFDEKLTNLVRQGRLTEIATIDPNLRELAAEDAADTTLIAAATAGFENRGTEVLSYEHPFGVGYLVAVLFDPLAESP